MNVEMKEIENVMEAASRLGLVERVMDELFDAPSKHDYVKINENLREAILEEKEDLNSWMTTPLAPMRKRFDEATAHMSDWKGFICIEVDNVDVLDYAMAIEFFTGAEARVVWVKDNGKTVIHCDGYTAAGC